MLFDWLLGFPWFPPANRPTAVTALSPGESDGFVRTPPVRFSGEGILVEPFQILGATAAVRALSVGAPVCILMGIFFFHFCSDLLQGIWDDYPYSLFL